MRSSLEGEKIFRCWHQQNTSFCIFCINKLKSLGAGSNDCARHLYYRWHTWSVFATSLIQVHIQFSTLGNFSFLFKNLYPRMLSPAEDTKKMFWNTWHAKYDSLLLDAPSSNLAFFLLFSLILLSQPFAILWIIICFSPFFFLQDKHIYNNDEITSFSSHLWFYSNVLKNGF
jgi:hypothetical protein